MFSKNAIILNLRRHYFNKISQFLNFWFRRFLIFILILIAFYLFFRNNLNLSTHPSLLRLKKLSKTRSAECVVPSIDPWDQSILSYYSKPEPLKCEEKQIQLVKSFKNGIIEFDSSKIDGIQCFKIGITHDEGKSDNTGKYGKIIEIDFENKTKTKFKFNDEFFEINCETKNQILKSQIFKYHYSQIIRKIKNLKNKKIENSTIDFPSVIIIGLDSMSRSNLIRQMPKTYKYLCENNFIDMKGHNKIHDNTFGNLLAILTGKRGVSVREFKAEVIEDWNISFDDFDMIWKDFNQQGYVTMFAEDRPDIGTFTFKNWLRGFLYQPTDHYLRPFWIKAFWSIISRRSTPSCYDKIPQHQLHLNYLSDFIQKYIGKRKFAFWWTQDMSHGFLNLIGRTDNDFLNFFQNHQQQLNDSIIYFLSDHGHRYDKIRETIIGRIESRMPMHFIRIPLNIQQKYPWILNILKQNSNKLTTQFDVNQGLHKIAKGEIGIRWNQNITSRAYSYFDHFPPRKNCFEAGIPSDFCPCFSEIEITNSEDAKKGSQRFVEILNEFLEKTEISDENEEATNIGNMAEFMCAPIEIDKIHYASARLPIDSFINDPKSQDTPLQNFELQYRIVIKAKEPSFGLFETLMEHNLKNDQWKMIGEIERNNQYGNTSFCVGNHAILKKICHCIPREPNRIN